MEEEKTEEEKKEFSEEIKEMLTEQSLDNQSL